MYLIVKHKYISYLSPSSIKPQDGAYSSFILHMFLISEHNTSKLYQELISFYSWKKIIYFNGINFRGYKVSRVQTFASIHFERNRGYKL